MAQVFFAIRNQDPESPEKTENQQDEECGKPDQDQISAWGAPYFPDDPWTPVSQIVAAATMLAPTLVAYMVGKWCSCEIVLWNGRPSGTGVLAVIVLLPGSFANHLACAAYRKWMPPCQKADRIGITVSVILQCWAGSQNLLYTAVAMLFAVTHCLLVTIGPLRQGATVDTSTNCVGALVVYGLCSMQIPQDWDKWKLNPYFCFAAPTLFMGFAVFILTPVRAWTDTIWHIFLAIYAFFTIFWTSVLERELYGGCSSSHI